jgi:hypothetical protein
MHYVTWLPYWAKDMNVRFANINAKAEGIESNPAFRKAFERRRCLVPVDSFYEWEKTGTGKQPYAIALADRGLMARAGLWENRRQGLNNRAAILRSENFIEPAVAAAIPVACGREPWSALENTAIACRRRWRECRSVDSMPRPSAVPRRPATVGLGRRREPTHFFRPQNRAADSAVAGDLVQARIMPVSFDSSMGSAFGAIGSSEDDPRSLLFSNGF